MTSRSRRVETERFKAWKNEMLNGTWGVSDIEVMTANYDSVLLMNDQISDQNLIELMVTSRGRTQGTERFRARK